MPSDVNGTRYHRNSVTTSGRFGSRIAAIDEEIRDVLAQAEPALQPFYGMMLYHLGLGVKPDDDLPVVVVSSDTHIGPRLNEDLRSYCPSSHLGAFDEFAGEMAAIVECSDDAIFSVSPEGIITSWNRGAHRVYGYCQGNAAGSRLRAAVEHGLHRRQDVAPSAWDHRHRRHLSTPRAAGERSDDP